MTIKECEEMALNIFAEEAKKLVDYATPKYIIDTYDDFSVVTGAVINKEDFVWFMRVSVRLEGNKYINTIPMTLEEVKYLTEKE